MTSLALSRDTLRIFNNTPMAPERRFVQFLLKKERFSVSIFCLEEGIPPTFPYKIVSPTVVCLCNISEAEPTIFEMNCP